MKNEEKDKVGKNQVSAKMENTKKNNYIANLQDPEVFRFYNFEQYMNYESDTDPLQRTMFIQQFRIQSDINQPFIIQQIFSDLDAVTTQAKRNGFNEKITFKLNFKNQITNLRLLITGIRLKTLIRLIFQNQKKFVY